MLRVQGPRAPYRQYSPASLSAAVDAVGDGVPKNESARTEKVPRATLQRVLKTGKVAGVPGKKPRLPPEVEKELVVMIEERQARNLAPTKAEVMGAAAVAAKACGKPFPGGPERQVVPRLSQASSAAADA